MNKLAAVIALLSVSLCAYQARADLLAIDVDAQAAYVSFTGIEKPNTNQTGDIKGLGVGARVRLQVLFLNAIADYMHLFSGAEVMHLGLGAAYNTDILPVKIYVQGSIGALLLSAEAGAFDPPAQEKLGIKTGFQVRGGGGLEIPFAANFLAFGVGVDLGGHYLTSSFDFDYSVNIHLGLRI